MTKHPTTVEALIHHSIPAEGEVTTKTRRRSEKEVEHGKREHAPVSFTIM
jgi:hypothetical protein